MKSGSPREGVRLEIELPSDLHEWLCEVASAAGRIEPEEVIQRILRHRMSGK